MELLAKFSAKSDLVPCSTVAVEYSEQLVSLQKLVKLRWRCYILYYLIGTHTSQTQYQSRVCSKISDTKPRHDVPSYGAINCAACHRARCLLHLLTQNNLHVLDIMLQRKYQPNRHHQSHADSKRNYESGLHLFRTSEEAGTRPDSGIQRVNLALSFETCKPFNPEYLALGWYDRSFVSMQVVWGS